MSTGDATSSIEKALSALDGALLDGGGGSGRRSSSATADLGQTNDQQPDAHTDSSALAEHEDSNETTDGAACFSPAAYKERLATFRTTTYFAKPLEISPLDCARFGWTNSSRDMLTCSSPFCCAAICIDIDPALGPESAKKLALKYRQMLATAHAAGTSCPFRSDAERWLLDEESKGQSKGFVVPPYLIPMSKEFVLLEDLGGACTGLVTRRMIRIAAVEMNQYLEKSNMALANLALSVPQQVAEFVEKEDVDATSAASDGAVDRLASLIYGVLGQEMQESDDGAQGIAKVLSEEYDFSQLTTTIPLLAAFGWRAISDPRGSQTANESAVVECRLCLSRAIVSRDTEVAPPTKRQRTDADAANTGTDMVSSRRRTMDILKSHRHYCPFVCGTCSVGGNASEGVAGWKAIVSMVIQQSRDSRKENRLSKEQKCNSGEMAFHSVRTLLRSALSHGGGSARV